MIYPFNAVEAVKIALSIEENGLDFYNGAAKKFAHTKTADLFSRLAQEEVRHKALFQKLLESLPQDEGPSVYDPNNEMDQYLKMMAGMHVFSKGPGAADKALERVTDEKSALELAISFEKDSVVLYVQLKAASAELSDQIAIDKLIAEESRHVRVLSGEYNKLLEN
ncbi:MAG: ferritin family protein [Deltaproteobacteria bacterium]|jgi:rubrerythrin|nr:ferritin family protein [Deltaproteobacteria bacterium]